MHGIRACVWYTCTQDYSTYRPIGTYIITQINKIKNIN